MAIWFQDSFESGTTAAWDAVNGNVAVNTVRPHSGTFGLDVNYDDVNNPDMNYYVEKAFPASTTHIAVRGYVYYPTPTGTACGQRKLLYCKSEGWGNIDAFYCVLDSWRTLALGSQIQPQIALGDGHAEGYNKYSSQLLNLNQWYCVEIEIQVNAPGQADGFVNVWIDGVLTDMHATGQQFRTAGTYNWGVVDVGMQFDPFDCDTGIPGTPPGGNEHRYWDDVAVMIGTFTSGPSGAIGPLETVIRRGHWKVR